jgi:tryptophanyl-tRNA synthetase
VTSQSTGKAPNTLPSKPIVFSGVQPTGQGVMLGTYLGALKNWVALQDRYECIYCVVDMHAITVRQDPERLRETSYQTAATYLACGIDPLKSLVFIQSQVPQHAELGWILTCYTYMGELSRMTQFKDKSAKGQNIGTGLFVYPSLMAADVLLYQAALVPVGHDQKQHLELMRDLALRFNNLYGPTFTVPEIFMPPVGARIMSLQNPESKMSKSDEDASATIYLTDSDDLIMKKFKRAVTDSKNEITRSDDQPGIKNLVSIQAAITGQTPQAVVESLSGKQYGFLKTQTAELVIELFRPIRDEMSRLLNERTHLQAILKQGSERAQAKAEVTLKRVKEDVGLIARL